MADVFNPGHARPRGAGFPPDASERVGRFRDRLSDGTLWALFASIALLLTVSEPLLDRFGWHYFTPGGGPWEKFHPGVLVAATALCARIGAAQRPLRAAGTVLGSDPLLLLYVLTVVIAALHGLAVSKTPVSGLVDTFLSPVLFLLLLEGLGPRLRKRLALLMCGLLAANAGIGLLENAFDWQLIPIDVPDGVTGDPSRTDLPFDPRAARALDWRASALLGHPLENAIVTGALILCLAAPGARWLRPPLRFGLLGLSALAMIAFGGRAALVLSFLGAALFGLIALAKQLLLGRADPHRIFAAIAIGAPAIAGAALAAYASGFLDRFVDRFASDSGSTNARVVMWQMFEPQSWSDLILGPDQALVQTWQRMLGIEFGIESFWIGLTLTYGLLVGAILIFGLLLLCVRVVAASGSGATAVLLYFFMVASTSTSLSSKTVGFATITLLIVLILPRHPYPLREERCA